MTTVDLLAIRLSNQFLTTQTFTNPEDIVKYLGAVQSQDFTGAKWAVGQRLRNATNEILDDAFNSGKILRTHVMRPTWHFVAPEDILWMQELTKHRVKQMMTTYNRKLDLSDEVLKKTNKLLEKMLDKNEFITRQEIKTELEKISITTDVQKLAHIVMTAELNGTLCSGPLRGKTFTYARILRRAPQAKKLSKDEALATLLKKFIKSHGPICIKDFVWWSGLTIVESKRGFEILEKDLKSFALHNQTYWYYESNFLGIPDKAFLLPNYDEYAISYKIRDAFYAQTSERQLVPFGVNSFSHMIVYRGRVIGMWKRGITDKNLTVTTELFQTINVRIKTEIEKAAIEYGKFLKLPAKIIF